MVYMVSLMTWAASGVFPQLSEGQWMSSKGAVGDEYLFVFVSRFFRRLRRVRYLVHSLVQDLIGLLAA